MKKKILITGFAGFVARNFLEFAIKYELDLQIWGIDISLPKFPLEIYKEKTEIHFKQIDLLNQKELKEFLKKVAPDYVLHLASFSSVAYSWKNPALSFVNNTNIFLNLVSSVHELPIRPRILSVGSSEEYGKYSCLCGRNILFIHAVRMLWQEWHRKCFLRYMLKNTGWILF